MRYVVWIEIEVQDDDGNPVEGGDVASANLRFASTASFATLEEATAHADELHQYGLIHAGCGIAIHPGRDREAEGVRITATTKGIAIYPDKRVEEVEIFLLEDYQQIVGGYTCSCGCGATKPDDGRCECGQPLGH